MSAKTDTRIPKPPKPPEKPLMPYMRYSRKVWEQVKNSNPHLKLWEVGRIIGQMWRELPDDERTLYQEEYDVEKAQYTEALRQYHSSPAYQAWLVAKERAEKTMEEQDQERKQSIARLRDRSGDVPQSDLRESYILEDNEEDSEDQYTAKHVAAARFQRNHRLMQEILSDCRLPDPGQLITQSRLNTLRLQVEQLNNHKRNLCQEIDACEARHRAKIQKIRDDSDKFVAEYDKLTAARPMITESQFAEMIVKAKRDLQREEEERVSRYLADVEMRRRRQQQRQQREAELAAEAERRRQQVQQQQQQQQQQQLHQQAQSRTHQPATSLADSNLPATADRIADHGTPASESKGESTPHGLSKPVPPCPSPRPNAPLPDGVNVSYAGGGSAPYPQTGPSPLPHRFPQSGHTQHHYPPPPSYPPTAMSPIAQSVTMSPQRGPTPLQQQQQPTQLPGGIPKASPLTQTKKISSGSSTSSASSASSTSSKKKRSDSTAMPRDKKGPAEGNTMNLPGVPPERRASVSVEGPPEQVRPGELSVPGGEYIQQPNIPLGITRHPGPAYQQPPQSNVPAVGTIPGHPMPAGPPQPPFAYEHAVPAGSGIPPGGYYHHPGVMPQSSGHPSGYPPHLRPQFGQHGGYPTHQYAASQSQHAGEHPPPPPMYVQHMSQQPHLGPPGGSMIGGPGQHPSGQPHQGSVIGWHQAGGPPSYPPQYAPTRYPSSGGPVGYPPHAARHAPAGYVLPPHATAPHPATQHPHQQGVMAPSSMPENSVSNQQQIPAPPPYQQQQQPQSNIPQPYWSGPHHIPPEYGGSGQPPSHQYISTSHADGASVAHPPTSGDNMAPGHPHSDAGPGHVNTQPHQGSMYYPGYPHPPMQGSYGPSGGFYVSAQQQGTPYPPPHAAGTPTGPWSGYPPQMGPVHPHNYPTPQQQQQQAMPQVPPGSGSGSVAPKSDSTGPPVSTMDNSTMASGGASGGGGGSGGNPMATSRPPSASNQNQPPV